MSQTFRPRLTAMFGRRTGGLHLILALLSVMLAILCGSLTPAVCSVLGLTLLACMLACWRVRVVVDSDGITLCYPYALGRALQVPWREVKAIEPGAKKEELFVVGASEAFAVNLGLWQRPEALLKAITNHCPVSRHARQVDSAAYEQTQPGARLLRGSLIAMPWLLLIILKLLGGNGTLYIVSTEQQVALITLIAWLGTALALLVLLCCRRDARSMLSISMAAFVIALCASGFYWSFCQRQAIKAHRMVTETYILQSAGSNSQRWVSENALRHIDIDRPGDQPFAFSREGQRHDFQLIAGPYGIRDLPAGQVRLMLAHGGLR